MNRKCFLKCSQDSHDPILLLHNQEVLVGRSPATKIKNTRCSKKQVSFVANLERLEVRVKQIGQNASAIDKRLLRKNERRILKHGDAIELVHGLFKHIIYFDPPPQQAELKRENDSDRKVATKRQDEPAAEQSVAKKQRLDDNPQPSSMLACKEHTWETVENGKLMIFTAKGTEPSSKIAAYDFDWTLVGTSSGRVYPKDRDDWCILLPEVPGHLKKLKSEGYKLVMFSNQAGIGSHKVKISDFQTKIERVVARLGVPMQAFISTGTSLFRKPAIGMWETLVEKRNEGIAIDVDASLYCGDAAGRPLNWAPKKKKDFSCSDRLFAMNVGLKFFTPEEHFQNARPAPFSLPEFKPMEIPASAPECHPPSAKLVSETQELAILVGCPGSGKSFVAQQRLVAAGYKYVNRDELKSSQRCVEAVRAGLEAKLSVVVDNTNPDQNSRAKFLQEARSRGVACRCLVMATTPAHARHNNRFRELTDSSHTIVTEMIIRTYEKHYQEPTLEEGFSEIIKVNFIPYFSDLKLKSLYEKFLLG